MPEAEIEGVSFAATSTFFVFVFAVALFLFGIKRIEFSFNILGAFGFASAMSFTFTPYFLAITERLSPCEILCLIKLSCAKAPTLKKKQYYY